MVEVIIAMAVFSLIATTLIGGAISGQQGLLSSGDIFEAHMLAQEGVEAVRAIRDRAYNELHLAQSGVSTSTNAGWSFLGEGTNETIGKYLRTITFSGVCRDGSDDIATCPATYTDPHTKQVTVTVSWVSPYGKARNVERKVFLSNWDSLVWEQTDWVGGSGQTVWSDSTKYDVDDGNVDVSVAGQVTLASSGESCGVQTWPFTTAGNYTYTTTSIEVTGGVAQLVNQASDSITGISDAFIDSYEFETADISVPHMVQVDSDTYVVAHTDVQQDGWLRTLTISATGSITKSVVDSYEYDTVQGLDASVIKIDSNTFAIAYVGASSRGWVKTIDIDSAGEIASSVTDSLQFDGTTASVPDIVHVSGNVYAIAYKGPGNDGFVKTMTIDSAGDISNSVIDTLEFDMSDGDDPDIIGIDSDTIAIFYEGSMSDGFVVTADIDGSGDISNSVVDSYEYDTQQGSEPSVVKIDSDTFAVAYRGWENDGWMRTLTINSAGSITKSSVDSLEFDTSDGYEPSLIEPRDGYVVVHYRGVGDDGFAKLVTVDDAGDISNVIDTLEFDTMNTFTPSVVVIASDSMCVAYQGVDSDGFVGCLSLTSSVSYDSDEPSISPTSAFTPSTVDTWSGFTEVATKNGGEVYYQLSSDGGSNWDYWNGSAWASAGATNWNSASDVNTQISTYTTSTQSIMFKAFLSSDGSQLVQLDAVSVECALSNEWPFLQASNYVYATTSIEVTGGFAQLSLQDVGDPQNVADAETDSVEIDLEIGEHPSIVHVAGDIYAVAYEGPGNDGFISTISISGDGSVGDAIIDKIEFDTSLALRPSLVQIDSDTYAVAYTSDGNDGWLKTVTIDSSGNIADTVVDSYEYDASHGIEPEMMKVDSDTYVIAYQGPQFDGFAVSITIASDGTITKSIVDSLEFDTSNASHPSIVSVDSNTFAVAYQGNFSDGFVVSFDIDGSGNISNSVTDSLEFDTSDGITPSMTSIDSDTFAVAFEGPQNDGFVKTFDIDASGNISNSVIDSYEFNATQGLNPRIAYVDEGYVAIAYEGPGNDGFLDLIPISDSGTISAKLDSFEFNVSAGYDPDIIVVGTWHVVVVYETTSQNGRMMTVVINGENPPYATSTPAIYPSSSLSVSGVNQWQGFDAVAVKNGGEVYYQLSSDNGSTWNYWNGSGWAVAGAGNYNVDTVIDANIGAFTTSTQQISFRAFLSGNGQQQVKVDRVVIHYLEDSGGSGFASTGILTSSAFNMGDSSPVFVIEWDESVPSCSPACDIELEFSVAPDNGGSPGTWGSWYGVSGAGTTFVQPYGTLLSTDLNHKQWMRYRATLTGDGDDTPILQAVRVYYR